jgi:hypothetical protein
MRYFNNISSGNFEGLNSRRRFMVYDAEITLLGIVVLKINCFVSDNNDNISDSKTLTVNRRILTSYFLFFLTSFW